MTPTVGKTIPVGRCGLVALVDDDVHAWASLLRWHRGGTGGLYARRYAREGGRIRTIYLHREIVRPAPGLLVDHINHDPLDNRRSNLRSVTSSQNAQNRRGARSMSSTGVRGVMRRSGRSYVATITVSGTFHHLGSFPTIQDAQLVVKDARRRLMTHAPESREAPVATPLPEPSPRRRPIEERFWSMVDCSSRDGCWPWTGPVSDIGCGQIGSGGAHGRTRSAHRVAFEIQRGDIPAGKDVLHVCPNRRCCRGSHLYLADAEFVGTERPARRDRATHCRRGHPLTPENTKQWHNGATGILSRTCRRCIADAKAARTGAWS